jgi:hypothetical protein
MAPIRSIEVLIVSKPVVWNLKLMMSYMLLNGLGCRFISRFIKNEILQEMYGFEIYEQSEVQEIMAFCEFYNINVNISATVCRTCLKTANYRYIFECVIFFFCYLYFSTYKKS